MRVVEKLCVDIGVPIVIVEGSGCVLGRQRDRVNVDVTHYLNHEVDRVSRRARAGAVADGQGSGPITEVGVVTVGDVDVG